MMTSFPGLLGIYCFNIFLSVFNSLLENNKKKHLGTILLMEFILFDVLRIFFVFLSGTGMLNCLPPFFSISNVEHLLKNCMKAFLATWIGGPFLVICSEDTDTNETKDVMKTNNENNNTSSVNTSGLDNLALMVDWRPKEKSIIFYDDFNFD